MIFISTAFCHCFQTAAVEYQEPTLVSESKEWIDLIRRLEVNRGHEVEEQNPNTPVIQAIYQFNGVIEAASDPRHNGVPDGY